MTKHSTTEDVHVCALHDDVEKKLNSSTPRWLFLLALSLAIAGISWSVALALGAKDMAADVKNSYAVTTAQREEQLKNINEKLKDIKDFLTRRLPVK